MNVIDIETFNLDGKVVPYCICGYLNSKWVSCYYVQNSDVIISFLNIVSDAIDVKKITFFCHNINFDGIIIIESLTKSNIFFNWYVRDLNIYWIEFKYMETLFSIRCSYKIIPLSISKLGNLIGTIKGSIPYKFITIETLNYIGPNPDVKYYNNVEEWKNREDVIFDVKKETIIYCNNDINIIVKVLENIHKIVNSFSKIFFWNSYSFSSISYKIYAKKFDLHNITNRKILIEHYLYSKKSYYGGRTEVFGNPKNDEIIHYFDFSGMYGQCMRQNFPIGTPFFKKQNLNYHNIGFHTIRVSSDLDIPILPFHQNGKLIFPNGRFVGTYWYEEILLFIKHGGIVEHHYSSLEYESESKIFNPFVDYFTKIREKGEYYKIFGKSMINGLYGSFALSEDESITQITFSEEEFKNIFDKTTVIKWKKNNNCIIMSIKKDYKSKKFYDSKNEWFSNFKKRDIAYASIISSKARIKLYNAFKDVESDGGRLFYCDTDSIFAGYKHNKINEKVGEVIWSKISKDAVFISPKFYYIKDDVLVSKGVNNTIGVNFEEIKKKFYKNESVLFTDQLQFFKKDYQLHQKYIDKKINLNFYDKRIFKDNKTKTDPITIYTD